MQDLVSLAKKMLHDEKALPFSVYSSFKEQRILNAPVSKPLLIFVLAGIKQLGEADEIRCPAGNFLFLSNASDIDMRNIPGDEYLAILVDFDYGNFNKFRSGKRGRRRYFQGEIDFTLKKTLMQFIEWSSFAPRELWDFRKEELLQLLYLSGYEDVGSISAPPGLGHQIHEIVSKNIQGDWNVERLAAQMAVSESTLRRRLKKEGASIKSIIDRVRLGHGLHLVQTTMEPIGRIAECCGYNSQSLFTIKFRHLFGITPTKLRKTRLPD